MGKVESFAREGLLKCGAGEMFGPGNAQLPVPNMLMMDRITRIADSGGAYGKGRVYEQGKHVGNTSMTQVTVGFQLGGQVYSQFIFFRDQTALDSFRRGNFEFGAQASAVAVTVGASADANYSDGVAIFTQAKGGLMYEASVGGQKFKVKSKK